MPSPGNEDFSESCHDKSLLHCREFLPRQSLDGRVISISEMDSERLERGDKLFFEDEAKQQKAEIMML